MDYAETERYRTIPHPYLEGCCWAIPKTEPESPFAILRQNEDQTVSIAGDRWGEVAIGKASDPQQALRIAAHYREAKLLVEVIETNGRLDRVFTNRDMHLLARWGGPL